MARLRRLTSVAQISAAIDQHSGKGAFGRLVAEWSKRPLQSVTNYKSANRLPPKTFLVVSRRLKEIGCIAPPALFGMTEPLQ